ncbi:hypothetical protein Poly41_42990 [Novipirellula artificiosorum]|uniref:Uncharacterized protein n=1 Tax=Novipirellula artificiosorum TaxID=2528016 RepID=A0A5C6DEB8_9BACT|nr:hypothetical protein Poly41_42990 [Novipirellula artificiosorum]
MPFHVLNRAKSFDFFRFAAGFTRDPPCPSTLLAKRHPAKVRCSRIGYRRGNAAGSPYHAGNAPIRTAKSTALP